MSAEDIWGSIYARERGMDDKSTRIAKLESALRSMHWHLVEGTVNREVFIDIVENALKQE